MWFHSFLYQIKLQFSMMPYFHSRTGHVPVNFDKTLNRETGKRSCTFQQRETMEVKDILLDTQSFMEVLNCDLINGGILGEFNLDLNQTKTHYYP